MKYSNAEDYRNGLILDTEREEIIKQKLQWGFSIDKDSIYPLKIDSHKPRDVIHRVKQVETENINGEVGKS